MVGKNAGQLFKFSNPIELLLGRLFFRGTNVQVHRIGDKHMVLDHRFADAGSIRGCVSDQMYSKLLDRVDLPKSLSVLDLGANVGGFPFLLHSRGHELRELTCVELNPRTAIRTQFNILSNWPDAKVVVAAVAAETGTLDVELSPGSTSDGIYGRAHENGDSTIVDATRLDDLDHPDGTIDVLKMDIEFAEVDVLLNPGHQETLSRTNVLVIEIHPLEHVEAIFRTIESSGLKHVCCSEVSVGQHIFLRG